MGYLVLEDTPDRVYGQYSIRAIKLSDMEPIRVWRNAQIDVLRQEEAISYAQQQAYYHHLVRPDFASTTPRQILLALVMNYSGWKNLVAYGGLTYIDWNARRAELSFLAARPNDYAAYAKDFTAFLTLLKRAAFDDLALHRVWHETADFRVTHYETLEAFGFVREGVLRDHVFLNGNYRKGLVYGMVNDD